MYRPSVLLADDHVIVAQGLARILGGDFDVVGIVSDGAALVAEARRLRPDVIVSDLSMPGMGGLDALRTLRAEGNTAKVVFLTMHADPILAGEALRAGAAGYVLKQSAGDELAEGLRDVLTGGVYLSPRIASAVAAALAAPQRQDAAALTARQRQVLELVVAGNSMKQIAAALKLSPRTVETHKYEMMQTLGVETTAELIHYAYRHGLVTA
jgi:DNA-binding NarL/FixJ family response regulator